MQNNTAHCSLHHKSVIKLLLHLFVWHEKDDFDVMLLGFLGKNSGSDTLPSLVKSDENSWS